MRFVSLQLLVTFAAAQVLGLIAGGLFYAASLSVVENPSDPANAAYFIGGILFSTAILLLLLKFYKGNLVFKAVEFLLVFSAFQLLFSLALPETVALILAALLASMRFALPQARQWLILAAAIIVGGLLGASLDLLPVVLFCVALMVYDFLAVFVTKHMVTLAKGMDKREAPFTIQFSTPGAKPAAKITVKAVTGKKQGEQIQLGTGDFVMPIVFAVSASRAFGMVAGLAMGLAAAIGLAGLFWLMEKRKGYYPGLPAIIGAQLLVLAVFWLLAQ